ncbi:Outer membrane protein [Cognatishimia activa]|uniref:Outer membrane protein n=1 Tax=Cognatishimia activa TaxID=1715691 RepID=A0A0P1IP06_9RHOB|nr:Outer membrane protein [Cognatishimia activa]CUK25388.1 Outer membrane protein [Cognatishimia activa]
MLLRALVFVIGIAFMPVTLEAQARNLPSSTILIIDSERLYAESNFGQRALTELQAETAVLAAEYRRIAAELSEEEQALTDKRPTMSPEDFRKVADAFDERVEGIRAFEQQRENDLAANAEAEKRLFFQELAPVLEVVLRESGALVVLEKNSVFASSSVLDVTDRVIAQANVMLGDGAAEEEQPDGEEN